MERERWLKVERLYHAARERPASERAQELALDLHVLLERGMRVFVSPSHPP